VIDAAAPDVSAILDELVSLVSSEGGLLHPDVRLVERGGDMHVAYPPDDKPAVTLIQVPRALLVPIDSTGWSTRSDVIEAADVGPDLSVLQREVLALLLALYNATHKLDWYAEHHPRGALLVHEHLVAAIRAARPRFRPTPGAAGYLPSRQLFVPTPGLGPEGGKAAGRPSLMPLVDLFNHHPAGASIDVGDERLRVLACHPTRSDEVFLRYGHHRDPLDLALHYGFVEAGAAFAFSAPISLEVNGLGTVTVAGARPQRSTRRTFPQVSHTATGFDFSHLLVEADHPELFHAAVGLPVRARAMKNGARATDAHRLADQVRDAVVAANIDILDTIIDEARFVAGPAAQTVADAARLHRELFSAL
jgi:hypothetical protein